MPSLCSSLRGELAGDSCRGSFRTLMGSQPFLLATSLLLCSALVSPPRAKLLA